MGLKKKEKLFSSLENREEKEKLFLRFLKIERRTRHENQLLASEREKFESFLFENFSRSRLLSMSAVCSQYDSLRNTLYSKIEFPGFATLTNR